MPKERSYSGCRIQVWRRLSGLAGHEDRTTDARGCKGEGRRVRVLGSQTVREEGTTQTEAWRKIARGGRKRAKAARGWYGVRLDQSRPCRPNHQSQSSITPLRPSLRAIRPAAKRFLGPPYLHISTDPPHTIHLCLSAYTLHGRHSSSVLTHHHVAYCPGSRKPQPASPVAAPSPAQSHSSQSSSRTTLWPCGLRCGLQVVSIALQGIHTSDTTSSRTSMLALIHRYLSKPCRASGSRRPLKSGSALPDNRQSTMAHLTNVRSPI